MDFNLFRFDFKRRNCPSATRISAANTIIKGSSVLNGRFGLITIMQMNIFLLSNQKILKFWHYNLVTAQGSGGETWGKGTIGETQTQMGG